MANDMIKNKYTDSPHFNTYKSVANPANAGAAAPGSV